MAGIYIHIPFCRKACHYCNFHFSTTHSLLPQMVDAIVKEVSIRKDYVQQSISTIYFGGGTPSLCSSADLHKILQAIRQFFLVEKDAEITIETNPDDITTERLLDWKKLGINRLSIGIQSFSNEDLIWMNRAHNAEQALACIDMAQSIGLTNISIDLIYGTPTLTNQQWQKNVAIAIEKNIPHISCYALTVEPKTALQKMIDKQKVPSIDTEKQAEHFELLMQWLGNAGYNHYEISNFAKPNFQSKHNSSYWQGEPYIGFGPSAHSFNVHSRQWNVANNALYIQSMEQNNIPFEIEILSAEDQLNEYIMTSLRTNTGLNLEKIAQQWGNKYTDTIVEKTKLLLQNNLAEMHQQHIQLTSKGKLLADGIAADLFFVS